MNRDILKRSLLIDAENMLHQSTPTIGGNPDDSHHRSRPRVTLNPRRANHYLMDTATFMMLRNATTTEEFYDQLEPPPPDDRELLPEALGEIMAQCLGRQGAAVDTPAAIRGKMEAGFRKYVALAFVIRPDLLPNAPAWMLAESIGVTKQELSRLCVRWSDRLGGLKSPSMKSEEARAAYKRANVSPGKGLKHRTADTIGQRIDKKSRTEAQGIIDRAISNFNGGEPFTKYQRRLLLGWDLIDEHDQWTERGRAVLNGGEPTPPGKESSRNGG